MRQVLLLGTAMTLAIAGSSWAAESETKHPTKVPSAAESAPVQTAQAAPTTAPAPSEPASAAPEKREVESIVVTARKRKEKLFDVPGPVTAVSPSQIDRLKMNDARDLLTLVPSAFLQENNAGTARDISIRGVGTPTLFAEPGVALYVDDVFASGLISFPAQFYDLERVEVLRGPQGGLYGRNAVGGAVNIISKQPEPDFGGYIKGTVARYDRYELQGAVNVPVSSDFGVRLVGWHVDQNEGEYFNPATDKYLDDVRSTGGRAVFAFNPSDAVSMSLIVEHTDADIPGTYLYIPGAPSFETKKNVNRDTQPENSYDTTRIAAQATVRTKSGDFTAIVGNRNYNLDGVEDTDLTASFFPTVISPFGKTVTTRKNETEANFVEGRWLSPEFGNFSMLAGVTYIDENATGDILTDLETQAFAFGVPATLFIDNKQDVSSLAAFVEGTLNMSSTVDLIGSLRYTSDKKAVDFAFDASPLLGGFGIFDQALKIDKTFNNWSPGITLAWKPADDWRAYAKVQTGFRAGGYNFNVGNVASIEYDEEKSVNYEIGTKFQLPEGLGTVGATAYYLTQSDILVPFFDFLQPPGLQGFIDNAGEARTFGVEVEGSLRVTDELSLGASVGYLDGKFTSGAQKDNLLPDAARWTTALTAAFAKPIGSGIDLLANASYTYRSETFADSGNFQRREANNLVNLSAGLGFEKFEARIYSTNLLDDDHQVAFGGPGGVIRAQGRSYGLTLMARY